MYGKQRYLGYFLNSEYLKKRNTSITILSPLQFIKIRKISTKDIPRIKIQDRFLPFRISFINERRKKEREKKREEKKKNNRLNRSTNIFVVFASWMDGERSR